MKKSLLSSHYPKIRVATKLHLVFNFLFLHSHFAESSSFHASNHGLSDELRLIHHEIGLLKHENQQQNVEISLLKKMVIKSNDEGGKSTHQNSIIQGPHEQQLSLNKERPGHISKRPARLLPLQLLFNRNCSTCNEQPPRFYGPPTNCSDLTRLGYTLNGFYFVKPSFNNNSTDNNTVSDETKIETVFCAFKQEGTFNASLVEKRIPPLKSEAVPSQPPIQLKLVSNENAINFRSQPQTMNNLRAWNMIFTRIKANVGEGFNVNTGAFQAPKSGVYKFIFKGTLVLFQNMRFKRGTAIIIYLYQNEVEVGEAKYVLGDNGKDLVIEETLKLNRGDQVELRPTIIIGSIDILSSTTLDAGKSSFSGFLINQFDD